MAKSPTGLKSSLQKETTMSETKDQKAKSIYEALYMQKRQDNDKDVITELVNIMKDSMISEEQIEYFIQSDLIIEARDKTSTVQTYLACRYFNLLLTIVNNVTDTDLYKRAII